jgi:hypothetical protein
MNELVRLLSEVIPLGLAAAITPTLLGLQLLVIGEATWLRRAIVVVVANALAFLLVMSIVTAGFAQLPDSGQGRSPGLDKLWFACGLILLVMSVYFLMPHRDLQAKAQEMVEVRVARASSWLFFGLAFYMSISDLSSFLVLLPGLYDVTAARADLWVKAIALAVLFLLSLLATAGPLILRLVLGSRAAPAFARAYDWVMGNNLRLVGVMMVAFGGYLVVTAVMRAG